MYKNYSYQKIQITGSGDYVTTGEIIQNQGEGRYILHDITHREFIYYSDKYYKVGTKVFGYFIVKAPFQDWSNFWKILPKGWYKDKMSTLLDQHWGFDFAHRMVMHHYAGVLYEKQAIVLSLTPSTMVGKIHQGFIDLLYRAYSGSTLGLTVGMLMGDRSFLSKEEYSSFVDSGLVHIVAVSGGNIVLLVSFLSFLLFFVPYYGRLVCVAFGLLTYVFLCGGDSSVVRATAMALITIISLFVGRSVSVWRNMGYVFVMMILWNPYCLLYDLGFVFSFAALVGLVFFSAHLGVQHKKRLVYKRKEIGYFSLVYMRNNYLLPTLAATIGIAPSLLFFTGRVNCMSILSNLLVTPLVPLVMIYGFLSTLLYSIVLWKWLLVPQIWLVMWISKVNTYSLVYPLIITAETGRARCLVLLLTISIVVVVLLVVHSKKRE